MERKWNVLQGIMAAIGLLVLIFDSSLALNGAQSGIDLCIKTVIPSLFPFFALSMVITKSLSEYRSDQLQVIAKLLKIPKSAASILIPSFLGGYPVGAQCAGDLFHRNQVSRNAAERLLAFCSNAGPSFLFGMVSAFFPERKMVWQLWFIHVFSAVLTATLLPVGQEEKQEHYPEQTTRQESIVQSAAKAMCMVCCWVILFRIIISFLNAWFLWMLPGWVQVLLTGVLELTNGCCELQRITNVELRFVLCACMLSLGGICVLFQTASVTRGLSLRYYLKGKLMQTAFSFLLSCLAVTKKGRIAFVFVPILIMILIKIQKGIAIQRRFLYNGIRKFPEA